MVIAPSADADVAGNATFQADVAHWVTLTSYLGLVSFPSLLAHHFCLYSK